MSCLYFCALCLEAKENRFICYKLFTPQKSDDGPRDEIASFELGVALALLRWVGVEQISGRLAGAETCRNTKQQKSLCTSFFGSEELMWYCLGMLYVQAASPTGKAEGFGTTEVEKDVFH